MKRLASQTGAQAQLQQPPAMLILLVTLLHLPRTWSALGLMVPSDVHHQCSEVLGHRSSSARTGMWQSHRALTTTMRRSRSALLGRQTCLGHQHKPSRHSAHAGMVHPANVRRVLTAVQAMPMSGWCLSDLRWDSSLGKCRTLEGQHSSKQHPRGVLSQVLPQMGAAKLH